MAAALAIAMSWPAASDEYKVFLLGGQSNMVGLGSASELPTSPVNLQQPQSDVLFYEGGILRDLQPGSGSDFGPEITLGRMVADVLPNDNYAIVKYAANGTNLENDWDPLTGAHYHSFSNVVSSGLSALSNAGHAVRIVGMFWTQGERDAKNGRTAGEYQADLVDFVAAIRNSYGDELPFFLSRLSIDQTDISLTQRAAIRTGQANFIASDANAYLIDTDGFEMTSDNLHFNANGQIALGEAFADKYLSTVPEPASLMLLAPGLLLTRRSRRPAVGVRE